MIKPIGPQYIEAKNNRRVGLVHVSKVIQRLMKIYGLEDELIEHQEMEASQMQSAEFHETPVVAAAVPQMAAAQETFAWFE